MAEEAGMSEAPCLEGTDEEVGEPYCFESDSVALKGNPDYHALLRTICILEGQRSKALHDLDLLHNARDKVMADPLAFVDRLQRGADLGVLLPGPQRIAPLPHVNWEKYTSSVDFAAFGTHRQSARLKRHGNETGEDESLIRLKSNLVSGPDGDGPEGFVRGRFKDESKSATFNKLWSPDEQKRLDELLVQFPPEEIEARRWRKIAAAFGDRTPQQIASRVQKYFEKLERARLPIPGRVPNKPRRVQRSSHRHHRFHQMPFRDSTFLQSFKPPVLMDEDEFGAPPTVPSPFPATLRCETPDTLEDQTFGTEDAEDDVPDDLADSPEYQELLQLQTLRRQKMDALDPSLPRHSGYKCDKCGVDPIIGTRYHCVDCPAAVSLDFCQLCSDSMGSFETRTHNSSHRFRQVKRTWAKSTQDQDYDNKAFSTQPGNYNYLDPNYMPAT